MSSISLGGEGHVDSGMTVVAQSVDARLPPFMSRMGLLEATVAETQRRADFFIVGDLCQVVQVRLASGQAIQGEPGSMCYQSEGVKLEVRMGGVGRLFGGSLFKDHFLNSSPNEGYIGLAAPFPATIIPLDLSRFGGEILLKRNAFLASLDVNTTIGLSTVQAPYTCITCCCAGVPLIMQRVMTHGLVFAAAHGTIVHKLLAAGEVILIHSFSLVACTTSISINVKAQDDWCNFCCSGQDAFQTQIKGPGEVWLSSLPIEKLRALFASSRTSSSSRRKSSNSSSMAGGIGEGGGGVGDQRYYQVALQE